MKNVKFVSLVALGILFCACSSRPIFDGPTVPPPPRVPHRPMINQPVIQKINKQDIKNVMQDEKLLALNDPASNYKIFGANGEGIAPLNTVSAAQALALAKRAAMADAYRQLAGKLYGVKINATDTVEDAMLRNSRIDAEVRGLVKNATITKTQFKDGLYEVSMELRINEKRWNELFAY